MGADHAPGRIVAVAVQLHRLGADAEHRRTVLRHPVRSGKSAHFGGHLVPVFHPGDEIGSAEEFGYLHAEGGFVEGVGGGELLQPAFEKEGDAVGEHHRLLLVVGDEHGGYSQLGLDAPDQVAHFVPQVGVQVAERLVQQKHVGLDDEGPGQGDALLLAARQLARFAALKAGQLHQIQHVPHPLADFPAGHPPHFQAEPDVVGDAHIGEKQVVLENHHRPPLFGGHVDDGVAVEKDVPGGGAEQPGDHLHGGGFAAPGRPQQGGQFPRFDVQVEPVHGRAGLFVEDFGQLVEAYLCHMFPIPPTAALSPDR